MPRRLLLAALASLLLAGAPGAAYADIFVSPFLGVKFRGATNEIDFNNEAGARNAKIAIGLSGVVIADKGLGVELEIAHFPRFFEKATTGELVTRSGVTTLSGNVMLALPLSVTRESLRPYVVGGLGWMHASAGDIIDFSPVNNDFLALTLGAGAVGFLTDVTGLRFDLRYVWSVSSSDISDAQPRRDRAAAASGAPRRLRLQVASPVPETRDPSPGSYAVRSGCHCRPSVMMRSSSSP